MNIREVVMKRIDESADEYLEFLKKVVSADTRILEHGRLGHEDNGQRIIRAFLEQSGAQVDSFQPTYEQMAFCPEVNPDHDYEGRHNVVGVFSGTGGGRSLLFNGHIDTVDFGDVNQWTRGPLEPYVEDEVDFDTFLKSDFRAVKIKNCEAVKKSDKLLKFTLDDGSGTDRIILSGIHQYYEPEQLIGKTAIAILNLPPRKMMGIPSCGMLISAVHKEKGEEKLHLMLIDDSVPAGAKLC